MYGLTEAFRSTFLPPTEFEKRPTSMGKAIPNTEIFVVSDSGELCGPGEQGTLVHRGPTVSLGYWRRPEQTAERFRELSMFLGENAPQEKVVFSGDIVTMDEEGYLYFIGRKDAMIKSAGHRISPWEIEEVVFKSGLVKEAAAIGLKDTVVGHRIKVLVVPATRYGPDLPERIARYCAERMPPYMVPSFVEIVGALPKTPSGKVDYPALQRREEVLHV
jgi:acyl-coenzyme A synthetase/AMP-(fatty) acid ligase